MKATRTPYEILQVHPSAVPEVIDAAFRALARLHHPDRNQGPEASAKMAELNSAYATLRDPKSREAFDRTMRSGAPRRDLMQRMHQATPTSRPGQPGGNGADMVIDFGRYAGSTIRDVARVDREYLEWLQRHSSGLRYRRQIEEALRQAAVRS